MAIFLKWILVFGVSAPFSVHHQRLIKPPQSAQQPGLCLWGNQTVSDSVQDEAYNILLPVSCVHLPVLTTCTSFFVWCIRSQKPISSTSLQGCLSSFCLQKIELVMKQPNWIPVRICSDSEYFQNLFRIHPECFWFIIKPSEAIYLFGNSFSRIRHPLCASDGNYHTADEVGQYRDHWICKRL